MFKTMALIMSCWLLFGFYQQDKKEEIIIHYAAISCNCAQWTITNSKSKEHIYLERNNNKIIDADKIWDGKTLPLKIKVTGYFKKEKGLPAGINLKGDPKPARVFKYDKIEILKSK